jgi:hypothetical protein
METPVAVEKDALPWGRGGLGECRLSLQIKGQAQDRGQEGAKEK